MLHIYHGALVVYLHGLDSFSGSFVQEGHPNYSQSDARNICAESIKVMVNLIKNVHDKAGFQMGWPIAWSLWVAMRHSLICEQNGEPLPAEWWEILLECLLNGAFR